MVRQQELREVAAPESAEYWQLRKNALAAQPDLEAKAREVAQEFTKQCCEFPCELREWREVRWEQSEKSVVEHYFHSKLLAFAREAVLEEAEVWFRNTDHSDEEWVRWAKRRLAFRALLKPAASDAQWLEEHKDRYLGKPAAKREESRCPKNK